MTNHVRASDGLQLQFSHPNSFNLLARASSRVTLASALAFLAGACFAIASGSINLVYALGRTDDESMRLVWALIALATTAGLAVSLPAFASGVARLKLPQAAIAGVGVVLFGAASLAAALGSAGGARVDAAERSRIETKVRSDLEAHQARALAELQAFAASRPAAEVRAEIASHLQALGANGCEDLARTVSRKTCPKLSAARIELARAERREALESELKSATAKLAALPVSKTANADAAQLAKLSTALGMPLDADAVGLWLAVLATVLVEFGGGICFSLAALLGRPIKPLEWHSPAQHAGLNAAPAHTAEAGSAADRAEHLGLPAQNEPASHASGASVNLFEAAPIEEPANSPAAVAQRLREIVAEHGEIKLSQRQIAKRLGVSPATVNRAIALASAAGCITAVADLQGTVLRAIA